MVNRSIKYTFPRIRIGRVLMYVCQLSVLGIGKVKCNHPAATIPWDKWFYVSAVSLLSF